MDWLVEYRMKLTEACEHYEKSAPTVSDHCNDLYTRMQESPLKVTLAELTSVDNLWLADGSRQSWMGANYAANHIYKLRTRLGMDTTGHAGF